MTAVDVDALAKLREAATPGHWKLWGMDVMADQDGSGDYDSAVPVAHTYFRDENDKPRTWDASLICEMQRALPDLLAEVRRGRALREAVEGLCDATENLWPDFSPAGDPLPYVVTTTDLRAVLAAVDGGEQ